MLIFKDFLTKDEFLSDTFPYTLEYDGVIIKVKSSMKAPEEIGSIAGIDDEPQQNDGEAPKEKVVDVVYNAGLSQYNMSKKEYGAFMKEYMKKIMDKLQKEGKDENYIANFKKGAGAFFKFVCSNFDEVELYTGTNGENEDGELVGGLVVSIWEEGWEKGPVIYMFKDALIEEKC